MSTIIALENESSFQIFDRNVESEVHKSLLLMFIHKNQNDNKTLQIENKTPQIFHFKRDLKKSSISGAIGRKPRINKKNIKGLADEKIFSMLNETLKCTRLCHFNEELSQQ